ncbi:plasmid transfer protein TraB [Actinokineospora iranica]|uniref:FtsK domain-containing protein n=1 Tax=Actinokineospora iranica TaxID=1271860 RepID=A0A1G6YX45_9PSEU|nr:plasmid transfer protein TraB [Actinokineospora iranica]SDD94881.1 hypothetical protein SAMN05216174_12418 [Actinokineospora iranica]
MGRRNGGRAVTEHEQDKAFGYYVPRKYWASRLAPYAGEWAGVGAMWAAGAGTHLLCADSTVLPWVTPGMTLLGTGLAAVAWKAGAARGMVTRLHATATTALGGLWMTACSIVAPWQQPMTGLCLYGGAAVALSWNIRRMLNSGGDNDGSGGLFDKIKLAGVHTGPSQVAPNKVTVPLALTAGETSVEDVQKNADKVAQVLRLPKGSVRIVGDPDDMSRATMNLVPTDVLRHTQPWPGPSHPGGSITDPIVPGIYEDTEPQRMFFPGDKATGRQAMTLIVQGMKGSGKTGGAKNCWTEILTRTDVNLIVLDPSKGEQSVAFLGEKTHVVTGHQKCADLTGRVPDVITDRSTALGRWGYDEWTPEAFTRHGMPYLILWIEEATRVLEDAALMTRITQECRSAGISVVLSLQKASYRQMSTDVRSQVDGVWCFGVKDLEDAAFTLSEQVIDAGARPDRWQNRRVGCNYLEVPGVDEDRYPIPGRTFTGTDEQRAATIAAHDHIRPPLWAPTAKLLGLPTHPGTTTTTTTATTANGATSMSSGRADDHADLDRLPLPANDDPDTLPADPEPDLPADPDAELPDDPDMALPGGRPTRKQALAMVRDAIGELAAQGVTTFTIRDLPDPALVSRGRPWLSGVLSGFVRDGLLAEAGTDGKATRYALAMSDAA